MNDVVMDRYYNQPTENSFNCDFKLLDDIDVVQICTTTFGSTFFIETQLAHFRKYFLDDYKYTVFDGNVDRKLSGDTIRFCEREGVGYVKLPPSPYQRHYPNAASEIIGGHINWIYKNYINIIKPKYFGVLDFDIFLLKEFELKKYLDEFNIYGWIIDSHLSDSKYGWYFASLMSFFKYSFVEDYDLNFMPDFLNMGSDSGGSNYHILYKYLDREKFKSIDIVGKGGGDIDYKYHILMDKGNWLHMYHGSGWYSEQSKKWNVIDKISFIRDLLNGEINVSN